MLDATASLSPFVDTIFVFGTFAEVCFDELTRASELVKLRLIEDMPKFGRRI